MYIYIYTCIYIYIYIQREREKEIRLMCAFREGHKHVMAKGAATTADGDVNIELV